MGMAHFNWFSAAADNNLKQLNKIKLFKEYDMRQDAPKIGFAAIHYAACYKQHDAIRFLYEQESNLLTKAPIKFTLIARANKQLLFPPGLNYIQISALSNDLRYVKRQLEVQIKTEFPLLSILIIGGYYNFVQTNISFLLNLVQDNDKGILMNPLLISVILGEQKYVDLIMEYLDFHIVEWMKRDLFEKIINYTQTFEFHALQPLFKGFLEMERCKELIKKRVIQSSHISSQAVSPTMRSFIVD
ncbi:hypothetical protein SS50377_28013 [Spironucleus salmonicida]|uniref:Ankyrin repeat-containing protein n=1 Tax=Spironucleus salmonicida TaxID=348837 RepID=V6LDI3_9EUKA|nr:hypothetical protein SS50377_28013 [Spironucleus salmonicida]|eukprot:EST42570.1 Hypothetical protein SS50377_17886 [Spironucleus salmonicida]